MLWRTLASLPRTLGALRSTVGVIALVLVASAPLALAEVEYHGWRIVPTVVAPSLMVMTAFVLVLDLIMTRVFMAGAEHGETRARLARVLRIELALLVILLLAWLPFLGSLVPD